MRSTDFAKSVDAIDGFQATCPKKGCFLPTRIPRFGVLTRTIGVDTSRVVMIGGCPTDLTLRGFTSGTHRTPDDGVVVVSA